MAGSACSPAAGILPRRWGTGNGVNKTSISLNGRFVEAFADVALIASRCSVQRAICEPTFAGACDRYNMTTIGAPTKSQGAILSA